MGDTPWWVQVYGQRGNGGRLVVDHCFDHVLGWVAPPECWAVAIVAGARVLPDDAEHPEVGGGACGGHDYPERIVLLGDRQGSLACRLHHADGAVSDPPAPEGDFVDILARVFGRPTPPPPRPASDLVTVLWLLAIRSHLDRRPSDRPVRWDDLIALHPACHALEGVTPLPADTFTVLDAARQAWSWDEVHRMAVEGYGLSPLVPSTIASWMDEGMLARWVLGSLPPPRRLLADLRPRLPSVARRRLNRCVAHLLAAR